MIEISFTLAGIFPALPTPIDDDGSVNYGASRRHIKYLQKKGVQGIVPAGCTGHAATLGDLGSDLYSEHVEYVKRVSKITELPVIAGTGLNSTRQTIDLAKKVEKNADIDAHLMISPYQNCPPQDLIVSHYRKIAKEIKKPIVAYNVPGRTGRNIQASTALKIAKIDGVIGIKEASGDYQQIREIGKEIRREDVEDFCLGSGDDGANDHVFEQGGTFAISVTGNVHPEAVVEVWKEAYEKGNHQKAYELNRKIDPITDAMFQSGEKNPMSVQYALNLMGFDFGVPRGPLDRKPVEENRKEIEDVLERFGLI